ncbi:MAG: CDP-alcohol phosphatidyltransferase family protein [Alistipes sp.]|nr:CDP-alcohol phosphatidyltransferase family protein [Alistipes sp.]
MKIKLFTIPNMLTLGNLICGSCALIFLDTLRPMSVFWLIVLAAVFDFFDGFSARILNKYSPIGIQLDSLADMVSFGLVPAAVLIRVYCYPGTTPWFGWPDWLGTVGCLVPLLITAFSALRLAKFNVDDSQHTEFCGLPTPANALFCTSLAAIVSSGELVLSSEMIVIISVISAVLLISPIRMFSLKFHGFGWRGNEIRYIFLAIAVCTIIAASKYCVPAIIVIYIVTSVVYNLIRNRKKA